MVADPGPPPPAPGPRPPAFVFPFAECQAAIAALGELEDELSTVLSRHDLHIDDALRDFRGGTADRFRQSYEGGVGGLEGSRTWARNSRESLEESLASAFQAKSAREAAIASWEQASATHAQWRADVAAAATAAS